MRQADAIRRQSVASMIQAVTIGMMGNEDRERAIDELELSETKEVSRMKRSKSTWDMLFFMKRGYGV